MRRPERHPQSEATELIKEQWHERLKWWLDARAFWTQRQRIVVDPRIVWTSEVDGGTEWMSPRAFIFQALVLVALSVQGVTVAVHKIAKSPERSLLTVVEPSDTETDVASIRQPVGESPLETKILLIDRDADALNEYVRKAEFSPSDRKLKEPPPYSDKYRLFQDTVQSMVLFTLGDVTRTEVLRDEAIKKAEVELHKLELIKRAFRIQSVTQDVGQEVGKVLGALSIILSAYFFAWLLKKHRNTTQSSDRIRTLFMYSSAAEFFGLNLGVALFVSSQTLVGWYMEHPPRWVQIALLLMVVVLCGWVFFVMGRIARKWEAVFGLKPPKRWFQLYTGRRQVFWDYIISSAAGSLICSIALAIPVALANIYSAISIQSATQ